MTTIDTPRTIAPVLRRLYFGRFAFAVVWAVLVFTTNAQLGPLGVALLVLYPLVDVAAAVVDSRSGGPVRGLYLNIAISLAAAIGVAIAGASGVPAVLRVWGAWAVLSGLVQLIVGAGRRRLGGQWPMIVSGGISVLAGLSFIAGASADDPALTNIAGYAVLGGIFFLISAIRLGRTSG